jgi:Helix-hairpin-helix motif
MCLFSAIPENAGRPAGIAVGASKQSMKRALVCTCALLALTACTPERRSPDAIREDTAKATSEAARDAKAVAQGVVDGLKDGGTVNVNKASADRLQKLPGIDQETAIRIINNRPYDTAYEMVKKHAISKSEYDKIAGKVTAK